MRLFLLTALTISVSACGDRALVPPRDFRLVQELMVDGASIRLEGNFHCEPKRHLRFLEFFTVRHVSATSLSARLPDGGGVVFASTPISYLCSPGNIDDLERWETGEAFRSIREDARLFLLDNATAPSSIEGYMSPRAFGASWSRLELGETSGAPYPVTERPAPDDPAVAVPWIDTLGQQPERVWMAHSFSRDPVQPWRFSPTLDEKLARRNGLIGLTWQEADGAGIGIDDHDLHPATIGPPDDQGVRTIFYSSAEDRVDIALYTLVDPTNIDRWRRMIDDDHIEMDERGWRFSAQRIYQPATESLYSFGRNPPSIDRQWFAPDED